jgi:nitroimidazol reductase NimA-like FMN-containing flavoprotein (pyridoxamine 5'-phosphate oxidase superfamily)
MATQMRELGYQECRALLGQGVVGRVAVMTPNGPHIVPVNYWAVRESIIVRTTAYSVLGRYGHDSVLAFEVDSLDPSDASGWSILARGRAEMVTDPDDLSDLRREITTEPWAPGVRSMYLRLEYTELSGRRLSTQLQATGRPDGQE